MADVDILSQLLEASWRGISFPTLMVSTKGGHNVVPHKRVDRDGWRVENTGRNSYVFQLKIPFINTIAKGPNETWGASPLYPDTYLQVLTAVEDRSTGVFQHPDYGQRKCKVGDYDMTLDPAFRGGPVMNLTLLETVDDGDAVALSDTAVLSIAATAAFDLDAVHFALTPPPDTGTPHGMSLSDFIKSLGAIADQWNLFKQQIVGSVDKVINACDRLAAAFGSEPGYSDNTQRLISALHAYKFQALMADKAVSLYVVPRNTTLPAIALRTKNSIPDLLRLNPALATFVIVRRETVVRYYA